MIVMTFDVGSDVFESHGNFFREGFSEFGDCKYLISLIIQENRVFRS